MSAGLLEQLVRTRAAWVARLRAGDGRGPRADEAKRGIALLDDAIGHVVAARQHERSRRVEREEARR